MRFWSKVWVFAVLILLALALMPSANNVLAVGSSWSRVGHISLGNGGPPQRHRGQNCRPNRGRHVGPRHGYRNNHRVCPTPTPTGTRTAVPTTTVTGTQTVTATETVSPTTTSVVGGTNGTVTPTASGTPSATASGTPSATTSATAVSSPTVTSQRRSCLLVTDVTLEDSQGHVLRHRHTERRVGCPHTRYR